MFLEYMHFDNKTRNTNMESDQLRIKKHLGLLSWKGGESKSVNGHGYI